jgi:glycyl-tRNA synthetase beta chain
MADLLLELFSEEIPARMQTQAAKDLERIVTGALQERGLKCESAKALAGSRRLALSVTGLPLKQPDVHEEKKGPRVGAPEKAIEGFLRSAGVTLEACRQDNDGKGAFYVAVIERAGRATPDVLAEILPDCFAKLPWPKSMRFPGSAVRWVRPLHSILCTFDGAVVPFEFAGVTSGRTTRGHRFLSSGEIAVQDFADYQAKLMEAHVVVDGDKRKAIILNDAHEKAAALGLELIEDRGLLEEVSGLAEWPVVLIGTIEDQFMDVPQEILQTSMRTHQKYFSLRDKATGKMANKFVVVSNMIPADDGKAIVAGNERVLRARLSDAKFFWDGDRKTKLADRVDALKGITFHAKLGTQYERVQRIVALAGEIAEKIGADAAKAKRAALLCKADLTTGVVGEFPELQGIMGGYYAAHDGEDADVAAAIRDHYKPLGPTDTVPTAPVSIAVALADKLDTLVEFFWVDEEPTGSKDPFALRRAALGAIRAILDSGVRLSLTAVIHHAMWCRISDWDGAYNSVGMVGPVYNHKTDISEDGKPVNYRTYIHVRSPKKLEEFRLNKPYTEIVFFEGDAKGFGGEEYSSFFENAMGGFRDPFATSSRLVDFVADRLKVALKEKGTRYDLIDAVFSLGGEDDLVRLVARVEALQSFLGTDAGKNLLAGYKRAVNILKAEEKKDKTSFDGEPDTTLLNLPQEKELYVDLKAAVASVRVEIGAERFVEAMRAMARLRTPVDAFFDTVTVNDKDPALRINRLKLLSRLRAALHQAADFSKIEG